jgi:alkylation response protein AidB-like acyl-CoA dehydrogenase
MLTAEQRELRALAREFADGELRPHGARWDQERLLDADVFVKLAELGFLGMRATEEYGGLGFDLTTYLLVLEELAWGDASVAFAVAIHNGAIAHLVLEHGTDEQKSDLVPRMASGELLAAFALSEPTAGSDPAGVETRAERTNGGWVLNGEKRWVTCGERAGVLAVFARDVTVEDGGLTVFLVESGAEGLSVRGRETTMGLRAVDIVSLGLDSVKVPDSAVLGKPGKGLGYALSALDSGRLAVAAQSVGIARAAFEHACEYALERRQFDRPIGEFGAIQEKLGAMSTRIEASRALLHETASSWDAGELQERSARTARAAMAKLFATETAVFVTDEAVQIFGGYGYMRDYPVEKLMRDARGGEIYEGTSEIMRLIAARHALSRMQAG